MTRAWLIDHTTHQPVLVTLPACPVCHSTARRCKRPSGHEASEWHADREPLLAALIGWPDYQPGDRCHDERCKDAAEQHRHLLDSRPPVEPSRPRKGTPSA